MGKNCGSPQKIAENCGKIAEIAEKLRELRKIAEIAENCGNCGKIADRNFPPAFFLVFPLFSMKRGVRTYWNLLLSGWGCDTYLATAHQKGPVHLFGVFFIHLLTEKEMQRKKPLRNGHFGRHHHEVFVAPVEEVADRSGCDWPTNPCWMFLCLETPLALGGCPPPQATPRYTLRVMDK
jgi:hypothetical protein